LKSISDLPIRKEEGLDGWPDAHRCLKSAAKRQQRLNYANEDIAEDPSAVP